MGATEEVGARTGETASDARTRPAARDVLTLFTVTWAMATLFHVWVNPRSQDVLHDPGWTGALHVGLTAVALWALVRPSSLRALFTLAALQVASAVAEAPFLGNHWLLVALTACGLLGAAATGNVERFLPVGRWCLLIAYGFAAFSKLNAGFFSPGESCGTFFATELTSAWGLPSPPGSGPAAMGVIVATVTVECSIPLLLALRRTRHAGVVVGLLFHGLIALDPKHLFTDFSGALLALFVLFLPASFAPWVRRRASGLRQPRAITLAAAGLISLILWSFDGEGALAGVNALGFLVWVGYFATVLYLVLVYLRETSPGAEPGMLRLAPVWLAVVPALVLANGLTPYVEAKTGFGWNMYSNLVTADGRSNHFLVGRTLPVTDGQRHLVTVLDSDDKGLRKYATQRYRLPLQQLRVFAERRPDVRLRYEIDGRVHDAARIGSDPLLSRRVPAWRAKFQLFRAVDAQDPPRCLDTWGVAR